MINDKNLFFNYKKYIFYCIIIKIALILLTCLTTTTVLDEFVNTYFYILYGIIVGAIIGGVFTVWYNKFKGRKFIGNVAVSYIISSLIAQCLLMISGSMFLILIYIFLLIK